MIRFFKRQIPKAIGNLTGRAAEEETRIEQSEKDMPSNAMEIDNTIAFGADVITERLPVQKVLVPNDEDTERTQALGGIIQPGICTEITAQRQQEEECCFEIEYEITFIHTNEAIL